MGAWQPLISASRDPEIPYLPGPYRIPRMGRDDLDYIGQTGMGTMTPHKRLGRLRGVNGEVMAYRDLHTAGRALCHQTGQEQVRDRAPLGTPGNARNQAEIVAFGIEFPPLLPHRDLTMSQILVPTILTSV